MNFDEFEQLLRDALAHLYDPLYRPPDALRQCITPLAQPTTQQFQEAILAAIAHLKPATDTPPNARSRRLYALLAGRYVQELTQEETAEQLGITPRHLRREQQAAVQMLAQDLWAASVANVQSPHPLHLGTASPTGRPTANTSGASLPPASLSGAISATESNDASPVWRAQVQQELAALQQNDPDAIADVGVVLEDVRRLAQRLADAQGVTLQIEVQATTPLTVRVHPSLLRQLVIIAVQKLLPWMTGGHLHLEGMHQGTMIQISITGAPIHTEQVVDSEFMHETLAAVEGRVEIERAGDWQRFRISVPYQPPVTVLVVDDNRDLVHFYRRYTEHTRYSIVHTTQGREVFDLVARMRPDLLVLDVMLPDIDGWEVLTRLHENPATRALPVIVCSVVRQEELALALGATAYLAKPVRRQDFIQVLDQVFARVSTID